MKLATKNQLEISVGRKEARWSVCISDIDPAKIMSQLCHSCGIWWANSTSVSAVPAYTSASSKTDSGEVALPLPCSLLDHAHLRYGAKEAGKSTSHLFHTSIYFLRASDGPNMFVTFSFTALQPCCYLHMLVACCRARSTSQVIFCSTEYEYCIMWLAEQCFCELDSESSL